MMVAMIVFMDKKWTISVLYHPFRRANPLCIRNHDIPNVLVCMIFLYLVLEWFDGVHVIG